MAISKEDVAYEVKINWEELLPKSSSDVLSPYQKFYFQVFRDSMLKDKSLKLLYSEGNETEYELYIRYAKEFGISVSDFCISTKDFKRLERLEVKYLAKKHGYSQKYIRSRYLPSYNLDLSPAEFRPRKPRWAKYDYVYVRLVKREN